MTLIFFVAVAFGLYEARAEGETVLIQRTSSFNRARDFPAAESASMLEKQMLHLFSQRGTPLSEFVDLIRPILDSMENAINVSDTAARNIVGNLTKPFISCSSANARGESEASSLLSIKGNRSTAHKTCRATEGAQNTTYETCAAEESVALSAKESACIAYDDFNVDPNQNLVPVPHAGESYKAWLQRVSTWATTQVSALDTKENACTSKTAEHSKKNNECKGHDGQGGLLKNYTDQKVTCNRAQSSLETAACLYAEKATDVCGDYHICYDGAKADWEALLPNLQAEEVSRKSEWAIVQRIRCYLNVVNGSANVNAEHIKQCQDKDYDTTFLEVVYPDLPDQPTTCIVVEKPCSSGYVTAEYGSLPSNAPSATCTACPIATPTPAPTPASSSWMLIAKQADARSHFFSSQSRSAFVENVDDPSASTYMSIGNLDWPSYLQDGKYKFKLVWGGEEFESGKHPTEIIWTQTSKLTDSSIQGFHEVTSTGYSDSAVHDSCNRFEGLGKSGDSSYCIIDGNGGNSCFWNCVGLLQGFGNGVPGPAKMKASSTRLYIEKAGV